MNLVYIAHARIPTEKAHGLTIVKSCESFGKNGASVTLVLPNRKTFSNIDLFTTYHIQPVFQVHRLFTIDLLPWLTGRVFFLFQISTFYLSVFIFMLFQSRKNVVVYTRDPLLILLSFFGYHVAYECHHIFTEHRLFFWLSKKAVLITCISGSIKQKFLKRGLEESRILVTPSGVDLGIFSIPETQESSRIKLALPTDIRIVLYSGNFTTMGADKGLMDICTAIKDIENILFVAVGGSETDLRRYQEVVEKNRMSHKIRLIGYQRQSVLAQYQRAADVLLMPFPDTPHYRSNMSPVKMFEYMASGRPIIASDLPTIREVLNSENSVLVPPGDVAMLKTAISELLRAPERADRLARQALRDVQQYSWDNRARRIMSALNSGH